MEIFKGVSYHKFQWSDLTYHLVDIDRRKVEFVVTGAVARNENLLLPTSVFALFYTCRVAINGDQWNYVGNTHGVVAGTAASRGKVYNRSKSEPTIYIDRKGNLSTKKPLMMFNAISGNHVLVDKWHVSSSLDDTHKDPRTVVGWNNDYSVWFMVIDGIEGSKGATLYGVAQLIRGWGAMYAFNMDGGASSTLVINGVVRNAVNGEHVAGQEPFVANHLGIREKRK
jgi:exopolysaccharide biosynthesis protein